LRAARRLDRGTQIGIRPPVLCAAQPEQSEPGLSDAEENHPQLPGQGRRGEPCWMQAREERDGQLAHGCRTRSVSSCVLALYFLGDPSTLTDIEALRPGPVADVSAALRGAGGPAGYWMPGNFPGIGDEYLRHLVKAPVVFGTQVNLESAAVESDRPRLRVLRAAANVARQCHSGLRCHPCPPNSMWPRSAHWPRRIHVELVSAAQGLPFSFR